MVRLSEPLAEDAEHDAQRRHRTRHQSCDGDRSRRGRRRDRRDGEHREQRSGGTDAAHPDEHRHYPGDDRGHDQRQPHLDGRRNALADAGDQGTDRHAQRQDDAHEGLSLRAQPSRLASGVDPGERPEPRVQSPVDASGQQ